MSHKRPTTHPARDQRFADVVEPELGVLLRVAMSLTQQPADAEDLVQDTVLRAYRSLHTFDGRHPRAWLLTILRNTHLATVRRRRPVPVGDSWNLDRGDRAFSRARNPQVSAEGRRDRQELR